MVAEAAAVTSQLPTKSITEAILPQSAGWLPVNLVRAPLESDAVAFSRLTYLGERVNVWLI